MNDQPRYSVISIDDHPLFRKGVADLIDMDDCLLLLGEAANGRDGIELARRHRPDLILLDINMKGMDGLATLEEIKKLDLDSRVLMLTVSDNEDDVVTAIQLGADGYLLKDMEPEDTLRLMRRAAEGELVVSERLTQLLAQALRSDRKSSQRASVEFTDREREILNLIAQGMSNKLIARELDISEGTVKVHVKHLLKKLDLHSRVEAAVWALKNL